MFKWSLIFHRQDRLLSVSDYWLVMVGFVWLLWIPLNFNVQIRYLISEKKKWCSVCFDLIILPHKGTTSGESNWFCKTFPFHLFFFFGFLSPWCLFLAFIYFLFFPNLKCWFRNWILANWCCVTVIFDDAYVCYNFIKVHVPWK